jgi:hypothetical protein
MTRDFFIDNQLYLEFLEITESEIPTKEEKIDKQELFKIIEKQFRKMARKYHPDYGGSNEEFKFLLDCKSKLIEEDSNDSNVFLSFDESKFEAFDKNSLASKLGNQLFDLMTMWKDDLNIKPLSKPISSEDEYEWIFKVNGEDIQLSLNVQNLSKELAELSHSLYQDDSLSVLVCLFVPSKKMSVTKIAYDNSVMLTFSDKILLESSKSTDIMNYFSSFQNIKEDIEKIKNGTFISKNNNELNIKKPKEIIDKDKKILEYLQNMKIFEPNFNERAADFLDKL